MKKLKGYLFFFLLFFVLIAFDQFTKYEARAALSSGKIIVLIKGALELVLVKNTGAVWGILQGKTILLLAIACIIFALLIYVLIKIPDNKKFMPLRIIVIFILSGALGNMIDRFRFKEVTDFIYISLIDFPVFNVADMYITFSCAVLLILIIFYYKDEDFAVLSGRSVKNRHGSIKEGDKGMEDKGREEDKDRTD
jgi:signal peptidase II